MKVVFKVEHLIVIPESDAEQAELADWSAVHADQVFSVSSADSGSRHARGLAFGSLGVRDEACREPINVTSRASDPTIALVSNLAATPFVLDERFYASVEGFWQGLKLADEAERRRIALLAGLEAKHAGDAAPDGGKLGAAIEYDGQTIAVGTWEHWQLMHRACWAKFSQCAAGARGVALDRRAAPGAHRATRQPANSRRDHGRHLDESSRTIAKRSRLTGTRSGFKRR